MLTVSSFPVCLHFTMFRCTQKHYFAAYVLGMALTLAGPAARATEHAPGVLILHSNQRPTPAAVIIEETLRKVVPDQFGRPVQLFAEYLDAERSTTEDYAQAQAEFLRQKYQFRNVSVIVASAPQA